jgi:hypothetical protein
MQAGLPDRDSSVIMSLTDFHLTRKQIVAAPLPTKEVAYILSFRKKSLIVLLYCIFYVKFESLTLVFSLS